MFNLWEDFKLLTSQVFYFPWVNFGKLNDFSRSLFILFIAKLIVIHLLIIPLLVSMTFLIFTFYISNILLFFLPILQRFIDLIKNFFYKNQLVLPSPHLETFFPPEVRVTLMFTSTSWASRRPQVAPECSLDWWNFQFTSHFLCRILCAESASNFHFDCLDFDSMMFGAAPARRLSTASSVTKPPHFILTTDWVWYWTDEFGSWQEYGRQVSVMERGQVFSPEGPWWRSHFRHEHKDGSGESLIETKSPKSSCDSLAWGELW